MTSRTILTLANGRGLDLLKPRAEDISFHVIAEHLAKENRYNGATPGVAYSVAQHSVLGAEQILLDTENELAAAYFLVHDGHEFALGDDTTPKKRALGEIMGQFGLLAEHVEGAFSQLTERMDVVIHEAAGLPWPMPAPIAEIVHAYDKQMLATEWRDLMKCEPPYDFGVPPLEHMRIVPWGFAMAKLEFVVLAQRLLPALVDERMMLQKQLTLDEALARG